MCGLVLVCRQQIYVLRTCYDICECVCVCACVCVHACVCDTLRSLYFSFINPYIDYNLLNWGMATPINLNPIHLIMKRDVRIMTFKGRGHHTHGLFQELEILPIDKFIRLMWDAFSERHSSSNFQYFVNSFEHIVHCKNPFKNAQMNRIPYI